LPVAILWKEPAMPAKSAAQQNAAGAALSPKRGDTPKPKLQGASKSMVQSTSERELEKMASNSRKGKPGHTSEISAPFGGRAGRDAAHDGGGRGGGRTAVLRRAGGHRRGRGGEAASRGGGRRLRRARVRGADPDAVAAEPVSL